MTTITSDLLPRVLLAAFEDAQKAMLTQANTWAGQLAALFMPTTAPSGTGDYGWLKDVPGVEEWMGSKTYKGLETASYQIVNKSWYDGFSVHKNFIRRQQLDFIGPRIQMLVQNFATFKAERVITKLIAGDATEAYDGVNFFSNASGVRVNDNLLTGSGVTLSDLKSDIASARKAAMMFKSSESKYLRVNLDTIICSLAMEDLFRQIATSAADPSASQSGVANVTRTYIRNIIAVPELDDDDQYDWYFAASNAPLKPFIYQSEPLENGQEVLPVVDRSKYESDGVIGFSAEHAGEAGYGFPELIVKVVNT